MAAERPPGGSPGGGASAGGGEGEGSGGGGGGGASLGRGARATAAGDLPEAEEAQFCGSSNPGALILSPLKAAATALAEVWKENPEQSHCWTTSFGGGILLDDDIWDVRVNLEGRDNIERQLCESDITYLNFLSLIETEGYGINDAMYYVREEGTGLAGMEIVDGMQKVEKMVEQYNDSKCLNLTVVRGKKQPSSDMNNQLVEKQIPISEIGEPVVYSVDDDGVLFPSQAGTQDSEMLYMLTQQSNNKQKGKQVCVEGNVSDQEEGDYSEEDYEETIRREEAELSQKLIDMKRNRTDPLLHCEGDIEPEELFYSSDDSDGDIVSFLAAEPDPVLESVKRKKIPVRKGPTDRSHCSQASSTPADFCPSSDDGADGDLCADDDDGSELLQWVLPSGRKSRAKKRKPRIWYDERRMHPEEQLCLKICFRDVY